MSILEDSHNLSKPGKITCTVTFIIGCGCLFFLAAQLGNIPQLYEKDQIEKSAEWNLPKRPEEVRNPQLGIKPKTPEELLQRKTHLAETLATLSMELNTKENTPTKKILAAAVAAGALHPEPALELTQEITTLTTAKEPQETPTP